MEIVKETSCEKKNVVSIERTALINNNNLLKGMAENGSTSAEEGVSIEEKEEEQKIKIIENEKPVMGDSGSLVIHNITIQQTSDWMLLATRCVTSASYDACGNYLALGLVDGQVDILGVRDTVLRMRTIRRPPEQRWVENGETLHYHPGSANSLSWSLDSRYLVVSHLPQKQGNSNCSTVVLWEVGGIKTTSRPKATIRFTSVVTNVAVADCNPLSFIVCCKSGTAWLYVEKPRNYTPRSELTDGKEEEDDELSFEHRVLFSEKPTDESNQFFTMAAVWLPDHRMAFVANSSGIIVKVDTSTSEIKARCELPWASSPWTMQILQPEGKLVIAGRGVILLPLDTLSYDDAISVGESVGGGQGVSKYRGYWVAAAVGNITGQKDNDNLAVIASSASSLIQSSLYTWFIRPGGDDNNGNKMGSGCEKWEGRQFRQIEVHDTPNRESIVAMRIHPIRPMVLAITAEGNALARIPNMYSDFAGPMYPSGYRLTSDNVEYHEPEDELDFSIVKNGKQWTKVPVHEVVVRGPNEVVLDKESDPQSFCDPNESIDLFTDSNMETYCVIPDLSSLHVSERINDLQLTEMFNRRKVRKTGTKGGGSMKLNVNDINSDPTEPDWDPTIRSTMDESRAPFPFPPLPLPVPLQVLNGSFHQKFGLPEEKWAANHELRKAGMPQYLEKQSEMEKKNKAIQEKRQAKVAARKEAKEAETRAAAEDMRQRAEAHAEALKMCVTKDYDKSRLTAYSSMENYQTVINNDQTLVSKAVGVHPLASNAPEIPLHHISVLEQWKADRLATASASQSVNNCSSQMPQTSTDPLVSLFSSVVANNVARTVKPSSQNFRAVPPYQERPKSLAEILSVQEQDIISGVPQLPQQKGLPQQPVLQSQQDLPQQRVLQSQQDLPQQRVLQSQQGLPQQPVLQSQQDLPQQWVLQSQQGLPQQPVLQSQQDLPRQWVLQSQQGLPQQPVLQSQQDLPQQRVLQSQQGLPQQPVLQSQQGLPQHLDLKICQNVLEQEQHGLLLQ